MFINKVAIIIPTHNESNLIVSSIFTVKNVFDRLGYSYHLILVDDCSTDNTQKVLKKISSLSNLTIFVKCPNQGKGAAIKAGFSQIPDDTSHLLIIDADLQIHPQEFVTFLRLMDLYNADVVVGNKQHPYSKTEYGLGRKILSHGYHFLIQCLFDVALRDTQCGFKVFRVGILKKIINKIKENRYTFDLEVLIALRENGFRVVDAPVFVKKQTNKGSVSWATIWITFWDTIRVWWRKQKGYYKMGKEV